MSSLPAHLFPSYICNSIISSFFWCPILPCISDEYPPIATVSIFPASLAPMMPANAHVLIFRVETSLISSTTLPNNFTGKNAVTDCRRQVWFSTFRCRWEALFFNNPSSVWYGYQKVVTGTICCHVYLMQLMSLSYQCTCITFISTHELYCCCPLLPVVIILRLRCCHSHNYALPLETAASIYHHNRFYNTDNMLSL